MRKLRIGFSKPKNKLFPVFSWAIRLYEKTPFSHVYIRWETKWGTWLCYHAANLNIHFLGESSFAREIEIVDEFEGEITEEQFDLLMQFCTKYVGEGYALKEVITIPLHDLGFKVGTDGSSKQYCAELVARAFGKMGYKELTPNLDRVKLIHVYNFVKQNFKKVEL